jgi:hypothetical protein
LDLLPRQCLLLTASQRQGARPPLQRCPGWLPSPGPLQVLAAARPWCGQVQPSCHPCLSKGRRPSFLLAATYFPLQTPHGKLPPALGRQPWGSLCFVSSCILHRPPPIRENASRDSTTDWSCSTLPAKKSIDPLVSGRAGAYPLHTHRVGCHSSSWHPVSRWIARVCCCAGLTPVLDLWIAASGDWAGGALFCSCLDSTSSSSLCAPLV